MRIKYIQIASLMTMRELIRRKIVIILLLIIPSVFYAVTYLTTDLMNIPFKLAAVPGEPILIIPALHTALVFLGLASTGLLAAFLSMNLIQRNINVTRRLVICGYSPTELALSKLIVMSCIIILLGFYVGSMLWIFFSPAHFLKVIFGFVLLGFVYGSYGMLVGALLKGELESILVITLLANIDVGWLQNPIFYAAALNKVIIQGLPAFYPSQISIISAFSDHSIMWSSGWSIVYGAALLCISLLIFWIKMRKR